MQLAKLITTVYSVR